jgi:hypothetical protein
MKSVKGSFFGTIISTVLFMDRVIFHSIVEIFKSLSARVLFLIPSLQYDDRYNSYCYSSC